MAALLGRHTVGRRRYFLPLLPTLLLALLSSACYPGLPGGGPRVAYIGWDDAGTPQLFRVSPEEEPVQLSSLSQGVSDFAPEAGGRSFLVASPNSAGGSDLWLLGQGQGKGRLVHSCGPAECGSLVWAHDGRRAIFEQRNHSGPDAAPATQLWWLDVQSGATVPVLAAEGEVAAAGRLSADGAWLSYVSEADEGVHLFRFADGRREFVSNEAGTPAVWSPVAPELVVPRFELVIAHGDEGEDHDSHSHDYLTAVHLFHMDLASGKSKSISGDLNVEDSVPAWSPDGDWLAFGRRLPRTDGPRQLWIMRKDGSEARVVAEEAGINFGPPQWTPDGKALVFQRFALDDPQGDPAVWLLDLESGASHELASAGMQPRVLGR